MKELGTELTCIEIVRKYYPALAKKGYTFHTNTDRPISKEKIKKFKRVSAGEKRYWDGNTYILTGEIFVGEDLEARLSNGAIDKTLVPIFAIYKQVKRKNKTIVE